MIKMGNEIVKEKLSSSTFYTRTPKLTYYIYSGLFFDAKKHAGNILTAGPLLLITTCFLTGCILTSSKSIFSMFLSSKTQSRTGQLGSSCIKTAR